MSMPWERNQTTDKQKEDDKKSKPQIAVELPNQIINDKAERNTLVGLKENTVLNIGKIDDRYIEASPWYLSTVVDSNYNPKDSLLTHISGSRWSCTYYQQLRDTDEALDSHSSTSGVYQQYRKIERFELRVDSELSPTQNEHGEMTTTGSAKIFTSLIPNVGDVFIADVNDGRLAEFTLTSAKRMTLAKNTCYQIEYSLVDFILDDKQLSKLEDKVFQTFVFHLDYLKNGMSPFLTKEETEERIQLHLLLDELEDSYISEFFNFQCNTVIFPTMVPGEESLGVKYLYDPFLTKFVKSVFTHSGTEIREYITSGGSSVDIYNRDTIWDLLLERRNSRRHNMVTMISWRSCQYQYSQPHLNLLQWSPIHYYCLGRMDYNGYCIFESETNNQMGVSNPTNGMDGRYGDTFNGLYDDGVSLITLVGGSKIDAEQPISKYLFPGDDFPDEEGHTAKSSKSKATPINENIVPSVIYNNNAHVYYVFSHYWYRQEKEHYSTLESAVDDYLSNERGDMSKLKMIVDDMPNWSKVDRFYFIPILYCLLKIA